MKTRDQQAEEYVKALKEEFGYPELVDVFKAFKQGWNAALKSQWRDVREELPEESGDYLVSYENKVNTIVYWDSINQDWQDYNGDIIDNYDEIVKYWMPIPDLRCCCKT